MQCFFLISEYALMLMFPVRAMFWRRSRAASLFYVIYAVFVMQSITRRRAHIPTRLDYEMWHSLDSQISHSMTAVSPRGCRSFDLHVAQVRSYDAASTRTTMAAFSREDSSQASSDGLQVSQWSHSLVLILLLLIIIIFIDSRLRRY